MEKKNTLIGNLMLLIAAFVWGCAFVAQSSGMEYVEPLTFNGIRMLLGGVTLLPVIYAKDRMEKKKGTYVVPTAESRKTQWLAGLLCGLALTVASTLQQFGLVEASPGKAGFLTALYIVLVPICRFLFGNKVSPTVWGGVVLAVGGIYFLCITEDGSSFGRGELLVLLCAVFFACHILLVDKFSPKVDGVRLSCTQFFVTGASVRWRRSSLKLPIWRASWPPRWSCSMPVSPRQALPIPCRSSASREPSPPSPRSL